MCYGMRIILIILALIKLPGLSMGDDRSILLVKVHLGTLNNISDGAGNFPD